MSYLRIYDETNPSSPRETLHEHAAIANKLASVGVRFERWTTNQAISTGASEAEVMDAYRQDIERLMHEHGYGSVDVISITPDHPERQQLRQKFLSEHTHQEDEVRFFVAGAGQFTLHIKHKVYEVLCEQGDLISVPDGIRHWFDMSDSPYFVAIRLFTHSEGWVAHFTGDEIAMRFPRMASRLSSKVA